MEPYRPRGKVHLWTFMKNYLNNNFHRGTEFITRNQLLRNMYGNGYKTESTMDTYRNYLTQAGYLSIWKRGIYRVNHEIPCDLSVADCVNEAYNIGVLKFPFDMPSKLPDDFIEEGEFNV